MCTRRGVSDGLPILAFASRKAAFDPVALRCSKREAAFRGAFGHDREPTRVHVPLDGRCFG
jgi:hypothetical protein